MHNFITAQWLPMRAKRQVIATQMFTGRREILFPGVIPTPNPNYPRTGNDGAKEAKQPLRWEGFSEVCCRDAGPCG